MSDNLQTLTKVFRTLSVETRVRILQSLKDRTLCVHALSHILGLTPPAVSQHLRVLRDADLVIPERQGYYVHYRVNRQTMERWREMTNRLLGVEMGENPKDIAGSAAPPCRMDLRPETDHIAP